MIEIVCHRGANEIAPENTLAAADLCIAWGVDYLEVDVRPSRDGMLYVLHDPTVDRTTDGSGALIDLTSDEVDRLDAGNWFSASFTAERVPRVEVYLEHVGDQAKVYFDVKAADHTALLDILDRTGFRDRCFFWADHDDNWARELKRRAPELPLKINVGTPEGVTRARADFDADIVEVSLANTTEDLKRVARDLGIKVMIRQARNDEEAFRRILDLDVDMVNLDHADVFLQVAQTHGYA